MRDPVRDAELCIHKLKRGAPYWLRIVWIWILIVGNYRACNCSQLHVPRESGRSLGIHHAEVLQP